MKSLLQKISYQIRPYPTLHKKTGKHAFGLQIIIDGDPRIVPIQIFWFKDQFDFKKETFSNNNETDAEIIRDMNFALAKEKSRANDILMRYRLTDRRISHKQFRWEFANYSCRENVHEWLLKRADKLLDDGEIKNPTLTTYTTKFARLKNFHAGDLPISDINSGFIVKFDNHLRKTLAYNTVIGTHKTFRKFFTLAVKEGLMPESPYDEKIKNRYVEGERECLEPDELNQLIKLFSEKNTLTDTQLNVLEMFVFAATSGGYRFSELQMLHSKHIRFGVLRLNTVKGEESGVSLRIDLPDIGKKIIEGRKGMIFKKIAEPTANKELKYLTAKAKIKKHITFHSARDTFGTFYVYYGGDLTTLSKDIFKHAKIETTMIYLKKSTEMKRKDMENFNRFSLPSFGSDNITFNDTGDT